MPYKQKPSLFKSACLGALGGLILAGCVIRVSSDDSGDAFGWSSWGDQDLRLSVRLETPSSEPAGSTPCSIGRWKGTGDWNEGGTARVEFRRETDGSSTCWSTVVPMDGFEGLPRSNDSDGTIVLSLVRDAGRIEFSGQLHDREAGGLVVLVARPDYLEQLRAVVSEPVTCAGLASLALEDVPAAMLAALAGVQGAAGDQWALSVDDILAMRRHGVNGEYLARIQQGMSPPWAVDEVVRFRDHGVSAEFPSQVREAAADASAEQIVRLRDHGVSAEFVRAIRDSGHHVSVDECIALRDHGVSADYLSGLKDSGLGASEIIRLRDHGVPSDYLAKARGAGFAVGADDVISLRNHGVSIEYLAAVHEAGYQFTVAEIVRLRDNGVSADYLRSIHDPSNQNLSAEQIIEARRRGLSAEFVKGLRAPK